MKKIMKKIIFLLIFGLFLLPSSAFATGVWLIKIDQVGPLLNYLERLNKPKSITKIKANVVKFHHRSSYAAGVKAPAVNKHKFSKKSRARGGLKGTVKAVIKAYKPKTLKLNASIIGKTNGLPVITVDYTNKPLWNILQDISNQTGYVFSTAGINLAEKISLKGRYNFAVLLAKIFNAKNDKTTVNIKTKKVKIWR